MMKDTNIMIKQSSQSVIPIPRTRKRLRNHVLLAFINFALTVLIYWVLSQVYPQPQRWIFRLSLATGYIGCGLLGVTLTIGTLSILGRQRNPVSNDFRRDTGIWCAIFALIHTLVGLNVHLQNWKQYFLSDSGSLRIDPFGFANYLGAAAILIVLILLITSNDFSLFFLKSKTWKAVQRWNYVFAFLILLHALVYILVENRTIPFIFILGANALWMLIAQIIGFLKRKQQTQSTSFKQSEQI